MHTDYIMIQKEIITASMVSAKTPSGVIGMPLTGEAFNFNIMKEIQLTKGKVAIVDDEDFEFLNQWKWQSTNHGNKSYAIRRVTKNKIHTYFYMHREIMQTPKGYEVDHIDNNGLNNQKNNLRNCTHAENSWNRKGLREGKLKGVWKAPSSYTYYSIVYEKEITKPLKQKYVSQIKVNDRHIHLGTFNTQEEAKNAYDLAAIKYHGKYAKL